MKMKTYLFTLLLALSSAGVFAQALKTPQPSPLQKVTQTFGLSEITVEYSRPSVKGRVIFGDLVPYGKVWRTGANQSTKITFGEDVSIKGVAVKAGTYALYSIPGEKEWTISLYSDLKLGGNVDAYDKSKEVASFTVQPAKSAAKTEMFTIGFENYTSTTIDIVLAWDNTTVSIPVSVEIDETIMKNIEKSMADNRPYFQAAKYYYDNGKDLGKALEWINKAVDANPNFYWVQHVKAQIQLKLGDYDAAIATAQKSLDLAKADNDGSYVKLNENLIKEAIAAKDKAGKTPPIIPQPKIKSETR